MRRNKRKGSDEPVKDSAEKQALRNLIVEIFTEEFAEMISKAVRDVLNDTFKVQFGEAVDKI